MSKAFTYDLRNELKVSNESFKIKNNYTEINKQEKFLSEIESSLQVSPEWHLKKKLAAVLERSIAHNFLINYKHTERAEKTFKFYLANEVSIGAMDKQVILGQVKATQDRVGENGKVVSQVIGTEVVNIVVQQTLELTGALIANAEIGQDGQLTDKGKLYIQAATIQAKQLHDYDNGKTIGVGLAYRILQIKMVK